MNTSLLPICPAATEAPLPTEAPEAAERRDVTVIVPTYCEGPNLPTLVARLATAFRTAGVDAEFLIVDDDSPDDTRHICADLALHYPLRLIVRLGQRGLASAVLHGIRVARGDVLVVMDADLSHPPERGPDLVEAIRSGAADFAIGSRYVPGSVIAEEWSPMRWLVSRTATLLAWPLTGAHDPLAGFFAIHRRTLAQAERLTPLGFKIGLELLVKCGCRRIVELPIAFGNRLHGSSKLSLRVELAFFAQLMLLYWAACRRSVFTVWTRSMRLLTRARTSTPKQ